MMPRMEYDAPAMPWQGRKVGQNEKTNSFFAQIEYFL